MTSHGLVLRRDEGVEEPALLDAPPPGLFDRPEAAAAAVQGRHLRVLHPWSLGDGPAASAAGCPPAELGVGVAPLDFHARWPWSARRWQFVVDGLRPHCGLLWAGSAGALQAGWAGAQQVQFQQEDHATPYLPAAAGLPARRLFEWPAKRCPSFSQFWARVGRGLNHAAECPGLHSLKTQQLPAQKDLFAGS